MDKIKEETVGCLRSCLVSVKGRLDLRQLIRDYHQLMGCDIPYKKLGFTNLEEFLKTVPSIIITKTSDGQVFADAKVDEKTQHISNMVAKQKSSKRRAPPPRYSRVNISAYDAPKKWLPKNVSNRTKTKYVKAPRLAAQSHNQFVHISNTSNTASTMRPSKVPHTVNNNNTASINKERSEINHKGFTRSRSLQSDLNQNNVKRSDQSVVNSVMSDRSNATEIMRRVRFNTELNAELPTKIENIKFDALIVESTSTNLHTDHTFQKIGDDLIDLYGYIKFKDLPEPEFKIVKRPVKPHKPTLYDCKLTIGQNSYRTYPADIKDEMQSKYKAAAHALNDLIDKFGVGKRELLLLSNNTDIIDRMPPLVRKHYNGIWNSQLEDDYKELFNEQLPSNWLEIIDTCPVISIETYGNKSILRYCNPEDLLQKGKLSLMPLIFDVSIPVTTVDFGEKGYIVAEITCAVSAKEIWCRQLGTAEAEAFELMLTRMEEIYSNDSQKNSLFPATSITVGSYYIAWIENSWNRIRVLDADENEVHCFLLDRGEDQNVPRRDIFPLQREFAKHNAQAFICRLAGLEELYEVSSNSEFLSKLEGIPVHLVPDEDAEKETDDPMISVIVYDLKTGDVINRDLMTSLSLENALPTLLLEGGLNDVFISNVESNGDIYIQIQKFGYEKLMELLQELEASLEETLVIPKDKIITPENSNGRLYFIKTEHDTSFKRIRIIDWSPNREFSQIYYVDVGNTAIIKLRDSVLYPLDEISSLVSRFPEQALRVRLDIEFIPGSFKEKVENLVPKETPALLKVVKKEVLDEIKRVIIFVRKDVGLVSVNESIIMESRRDIITKPEKLEKIMFLDNESKTVPSTGNLRSPRIPSINSYFDVNVPTAVSPWNFFVQPYESSDKLKQLMNDLQTRYCNIRYSPLRSEDIRAGKIYASKRNDGNWYRTSVIKVINPSSISVFYCDFGYYANLTLQQLIPLDPDLQELPYQAIKAKLSGIKPKNAKWTMDDCKYFQKLVVQKSLVSIIHSVEKDELYRCDTILGLELVDTSTEVDIDIQKALIKEEIAANDS